MGICQLVLYAKFCAKCHTHTHTHAHIFILTIVRLTTLIPDLIVDHMYLKKYWGKQLTLYRKQNIDFRITKSLRVT